MEEKPIDIRGIALFCVLLLLFISYTAEGGTGSQNPGYHLTGVGGTIFLIIHPAEITLDSAGLLNPGILSINEQEYRNYLEILNGEKAGSDPKNRIIDEVKATGTVQEFPDKYNPDNPLFQKEKREGDLFTQAGGVEDTLAGSFSDPSMDETGTIFQGLTDTLNPTRAKGTGGTVISPKGLDSGSTGQMRVSGFGSGSWIFSMGDENPAGAQSHNDGWVSDYTPEDQSASDITPEDQSGKESTQKDQSTSDSTPEDQSTSDSTPEDQSTSDSTPEDQSTCDSTPEDQSTSDSTPEDQSANDSTSGDQSTSDGTPEDQSASDSSQEDQSDNGSTPEEQSKTYDDGSGTGADDPNSVGNRLSGVTIKQKDNLDQVANDGGASSRINKKYKWLINASKQPGFFVPESGGYKPGDTGLGRDVGIVTYDRTGLPRVNTEKKIPWYLQPVAQPKDLGYAPEMAETAGESRTYEFSSENMMASPEAMGGQKPGGSPTNTAGGGPALFI